MQAKLTYAIKFVSDMEVAVGFYRDTMGLKLRFATPGWSEFETGDVTLALHSASVENPVGQVQLGFGTPDLAQLYACRDANGLTFTAAPEVRFGTLLARMLDGEGVEVSLSGPAE